MDILMNSCSMENFFIGQPLHSQVDFRYRRCCASAGWRREWIFSSMLRLSASTTRWSPSNPEPFTPILQSYTHQNPRLHFLLLICCIRWSPPNPEPYTPILQSQTHTQSFDFFFFFFFVIAPPQNPESFTPIPQSFTHTHTLYTSSAVLPKPRDK